MGHIARFASTHDERRHGNVRVPSGDQSTVIVDHQRASRTRLESPLDGVLSSIVPAAFFARFSNRRRLTRLATDDGPSRAFSTRADVLFEQGNFLARTHQVRDAR